MCRPTEKRSQKIRCGFSDLFISFIGRKYQILPAQSQSCFKSTQPASDVRQEFRVKVFDPEHRGPGSEM